MNCRLCNGKATIYRPVKKITKEITRMIDGMETTETLTTESGGWDACPECASWAENEFRSVHGHPRAKIRRII